MIQVDSCPPGTVTLATALIFMHFQNEHCFVALKHNTHYRLSNDTLNVFLRHFFFKCD